jgi:hypothetical protein
MKKLIFSVFLANALLATAQTTDTISVMSYNLLNFPFVNSSRINDLKIILQESLPDVLVVNELTSASGANGILSNALNQNGVTYYEKAAYVAGPDTQNMLYYNSGKLGLKEQNEITTTLRDINEYVLYFKSDDIATTTDTTFFYVYGCHLKASQGEETQRNSEVTAMKQYMATRLEMENVLCTGDFNLYGSSEPAWNTILNGEGVTLVDPINTPGEWHVDASFQTIHTQSTRTTSFDGGATGGMDDRFDFIFMSPDLNNWGNQAKYVDGSYWAYGQDGNHYNGSFIDAPTNTTLAPTVIQALYDMSDHLPVYMEIAVQKTFNSIDESSSGIKAYFVQATNEIQFYFTSEIKPLEDLRIYDLSGKLMMSFPFISESNTIDVSLLENGMYILQVESHSFSTKFAKH